ncbi:MAG: hypothetical protein ACPIOQ_28385, partial [Promethearchaeia archaeon]
FFFLLGSFLTSLSSLFLGLLYGCLLFFLLSFHFTFNLLFFSLLLRLRSLCVFFYGFLQIGIGGVF